MSLSTTAIVCDGLTARGGSINRFKPPTRSANRTATDTPNTTRWYDHSCAPAGSVAVTDTAWALWYIAHTDDKRRGRLNVTHLLRRIPYQPLARNEVTLPKRQKPGNCSEPDRVLRYIPTPF
jgi:polyphosphate kinase